RIASLMTALKTKTPSLSALEIAQDLIRIPSVTPDSGACMSYIESYLVELGFSCTRYDKTGTANLFAILEKGAGPHLCFAGHTDVVPSGKVTQWKHPPFAPTIDGG